MRALLKLLIVFAVLSSWAISGMARAQDPGPTPDPDTEPAIIEETKPVEAKFAGVTGGAIAGAEIVIVTEALIGVKQKWAYWVLPLIGAAGGGVGGYFLEQESPKGAVALLAGAMAMIIPTALAASAGMAYNPEDEEGIMVESFESDTGFSFELPPRGETEETTSTEVEARPDVPAGAGPPPPSQPQPDDAEPQPEAPQPESSASSSATTNGQRAASPGPSGVGALVRVDALGTPHLQVPILDIRPTPAAVTLSAGQTSPGIELYVPIIHVDLP